MKPAKRHESRAAAEARDKERKRMRDAKKGGNVTAKSSASAKKNGNK